MPRKYNSLNDVKTNFLEIGMCPICSMRLTAECEHRTEESEQWYAAHILAEQELYTEQLPPYVEPDASLLPPVLESFNKRVGYDIVSAICTKSPERIKWEAEYLRKRANHRKKYFGGVTAP